MGSSQTMLSWLGPGAARGKWLRGRCWAPVGSLLNELLLPRQDPEAIGLAIKSDTPLFLISI